ncbi:MAG: alpha-L-fucosidase [Armatimonadetes bacterium]|nr:alpha-L-fucosidase [Armatimonadota bacterium]
MVDGTSPDMWGKAGAQQEGDPKRGAWLRESRFAMFIHWGLYSELAARWKGRTYYGISEWIMSRARIPVSEYEQVAARFNPVEFDAAEWVGIAKAAGMRHIMITAKHHDGFALFGSRVSTYNIVDATPFGRDPLKELAEACRAEGLRLGFYYSQTQDWHEQDAVGNSWDWPKGGDFGRYLHGKVVPQLRELLTGYGPIAGVWFDTPGPITPDQSRMLVDLVHELQPECLVNSRIGNGLGDYDTLGDQEIPRLPREGLWETPDTHNDTWGYAWYDRNFKGPRTVAERLVRVASRGGTYMINVGPDGLGRIPEVSERILREVGRWVHAHEHAIHGVDPTPLGPLPWGECTAEGNRLHLHVFDWPASGRLVVPGLHSPVEAARIGDETLTATSGYAHVVVQLPAARPGELIPVVTLDMAEPIEADRELTVLAGCANVLDSGLAEMTGCELRTVQWMEKFGDWQHAECIGGWREGSAARWTFRTVEPGSYALELEYTCPAKDDYAEWRIRCDGLELTFPLIDTGERDRREAFGGQLPRFRTYRVGIVDFPEPGAHEISTGPVEGNGLGMRLALVRLVPVAGPGS